MIVCVVKLLFARQHGMPADRRDDGVDTLVQCGDVGCGQAADRQHQPAAFTLVQSQGEPALHVLYVDGGWLIIPAPYGSEDDLALQRGFGDLGGLHSIIDAAFRQVHTELVQRHRHRAEAQAKVIQQDRELLYSLRRVGVRDAMWVHAKRPTTVEALVAVDDDMLVRCVFERFDDLLVQAKVGAFTPWIWAYRWRCIRFRFDLI